MKILYLTLKKKWFDLIKSGKKKSEFREIKPYWKTRLEGKEFDFIIFRNGYLKESPTLKIEWKGIVFGEFEGKKCYEIKLGEIIK
jgi:ASC-1-like (ASCH) protein